MGPLPDEITLKLSQGPEDVKDQSCLSASLRRRFRGSSTKATECGPFTHGDSGCSTPTIQRPFGRWAGPVRPKRREPDKHEMRAAYHADSALDAEAQLTALARELDKTHPGAA